MSGIKRPLFAALLCVGLAFSTGSESAAASKKPAGVKNSAAAKKTGANPSNPQLDRALEAIRADLNKADHDYKGHRAAAVHEITHAIHLLQHGKVHPKPGQHFVGGKHTEPQNISDGRLKKCIAAIQGLTVPPGKHQAQVKAALAKAVNDLQAALKIA